MSVNILNMFLASPGDLKSERIAARKSVDDANLVVHDLGWSIELHVWEDAMPGAGRPQGLINADVDQCDLFVGLLCQRWGTPTGEYSSGFEEEFQRVLDRRQKTGEPEIWLFFKDVPEDRLEDPGPQLRRVMEFKQQRVQSRDVLFATFQTTEDWKALIARDLPRLITGRVKAAREVAVSEPQEKKMTPIVNAPADKPIERQGADIKELNDLFRKLQETTDIEQESYSFELTNPLAARLYLFASTFHRSRFSDTYPDAHAINALYAHREDYHFTALEKRLLWTSIVADANSVIPGWYWFRDRKASSISAMFWLMITSEQDERTKVAALKMMTTIPIELSDEAEEREFVIKMMFASDSDKVRVAGLEYLESVGCHSDTKVLRDEELVDEQSLNVVEQQIGARLDPERIARQICEEGTEVAPGVVGKLHQALVKCETAVVRAGLSHSDESVRLACLIALQERGINTEGVLRVHLQDKSIEVRQHCYSQLVERGVRFDTEDVRKALQAEGKGSLLRAMSSGDPDAIIIEMFRQDDLATLRGKISWFNADGPLAYRVMASKFFTENAERIRQDLRDNFKQLKQDSIDQLRAEMGGSAVIDTYLSARDDHKVDEYIRICFVEAALVALSEYGQQSDAILAKSFLQLGKSGMEWYRVGKHAMALLARVGQASDATELVRVALEDPIIAGAEAAAQAAMRLDPGISETWKSLVLSDNHTLVEAALETLCEAEVTEALEVVEPLLNSENTAIRDMAAKLCCQHGSVEYLTSLLERYLKLPTYYYNVVCAIDFALFAPWGKKVSG